MATCNFNTISERDMDLLLQEAIVTDPDFGRLIVDKTDLEGKPFKVISSELSRSDTELGESDVIVVFEIEGKRLGFLIEDKVDANAQPDQHMRYVKRAEKAVLKKEYDDYRIFIFCPQKYYNGNAEARLYEHLLSYEECRDLFKRKDDLISQVRAQQLEQAIHKAKNPSRNHVDKEANAFFQEYIAFQKKHYPGLDMSSKSTSSGMWVEYRTNFGKVYIIHKSDRGQVDLTFPRSADKLNTLRNVAEWARKNGVGNITAELTGKSSALRIRVPEMDFKRPFSNVTEDTLVECLEAIQKLTDLANIMEDMRFAGLMDR